MQEKTTALQANDFIKSPTVLEFLNLPSNLAYTEAELEKALIDNLQQFMLELGKGFAFVARQQHNDNAQLFASKYMAYLPSEEELVREIEQQKIIFEQQFEKIIHF